MFGALILLTTQTYSNYSSFRNPSNHKEVRPVGDELIKENLWLPLGEATTKNAGKINGQQQDPPQKWVKKNTSTRQITIFYQQPFPLTWEKLNVLPKILLVTN